MMHAQEPKPVCPRCARRFTIKVEQYGYYYCRSCGGIFEDPIATPFDAIVDSWTESLVSLQRSGDVIVVALPNGKLGVSLISVIPQEARPSSIPGRSSR